MDRSALWAPFEDKSTQLGTGSGAVSTLCVTQRPLRLRGFAICKVRRRAQRTQRQTDETTLGLLLSGDVCSLRFEHKVG